MERRGICATPIVWSIRQPAVQSQIAEVLFFPRPSASPASSALRGLQTPIWHLQGSATKCTENRFASSTQHLTGA